MIDPMPSLATSAPSNDQNLW
ncbi:MAG: hypothetical protein QOF66_736, partial [Mycobacterium sp.]|nr:hypothetical protein [Mycobacterium sp.]